MSLSWAEHTAAQWVGRRRPEQALLPIHRLAAAHPGQLLGIDRQKEAFFANLERFLAGAPCNHVLLWGARGTGKSTLVRAALQVYREQGLRAVQIDRDDLPDLPLLQSALEREPWKFLLFCDDLSFAAGESGFRALRSLMEGSLAAVADNILICATSNRRHLLPESMAENQEARLQGTEIHLSDAAEESLALSDRFGLSLAFHPIDQPAYLAMIDRLFDTDRFNRADRDALHRAACRFALERGGRSGRVAQQFWRSGRFSS